MSFKKGGFMNQTCTSFCERFKKYQATSAGVGILPMRFLIGWIFFKAGTGKLFGWFGGHGIEGITQFFTQLGLPAPHFQAWFVGVNEALWGALLFVGLFTRFAVIPLGIVMIAAIFTVHRTSGYEYPLVILTGCLAMLHTGSGPLSLDKTCCTKNSFV